MSSALQASTPVVYRTQLPLWRIVKTGKYPELIGRYVEARTVSECRGVLKQCIPGIDLQGIELQKES
jgi:hypothetical protein